MAKLNEEIHADLQQKLLEIAVAPLIENLNKLIDLKNRETTEIEQERQILINIILNNGDGQLNTLQDDIVSK